LLKASLAYFTLTFAEPDLEQPLNHPATSPAIIPAMSILAPDDLGLTFMKTKLASMQGFVREFSSGRLEPAARIESEGRPGRRRFRQSNGRSRAQSLKTSEQCFSFHDRLKLSLWPPSIPPVYILPVG
jgi:hypothetical protein